MNPGSEAEERNESVIKRCEVTPQVNQPVFSRGNEPPVQLTTTFERTKNDQALAKSFNELLAEIRKTAAESIGAN